MAALELSAGDLLFVVDELADARLVGQEHPVLIHPGGDHVLELCLRLLVDLGSRKRLNDTVFAAGADGLSALSEADSRVFLLLAPLFDQF